MSGGASAGYVRPDKPHDVYRLYDVDDALLYVGITSQGMVRLANHASTADWWPQVAVITIVHCPDRRTALDLEHIAIEEEDPVYNIRRPSWDHGEPARLLAQARRLAHEQGRSLA